MSIIKILSHEEAQKIAAGEVIERPANIVKELIENALDAGATELSIYIEDAGKTLIRVIDNGCGMSADDARLCFLPHATSKIASIHDLDHIASFGFRGEALASIAAVSKVTLITKLQQNDNLGICLEYAASALVHEQAIACSSGTDISVRDLFYNIPVRKKFLKQDETEWNQILTLVHAFCLSNHKLTLKLYHNNKLIVNAPPVSDLLDRVSQLFGYQFSQNLLTLKEEKSLSSQTMQESWFAFDGLVSHPHFWRYGRHSIFFFVNQRWVKDQELSRALMKGYSNVLPQARFPAAFIFIRVQQGYVDVNVHPKKEEVRFLKPGAIQTALQELVKQALEQRVTTYLNPLSKKQIVEKEAFVEKQRAPIFFGKKHDQSVSVNPPFHHEIEKSFNKFSHHTDGEINRDAVHRPMNKSTDRSKSEQDKLLACARPEETNEVRRLEGYERHYVFRFVGQLFNTYLIIEHDNTVVMIDQHAAHERILYERFTHKFTQLEGTALLFPEIIVVPEHRMTLLMQEQEFFMSLGIEFELFGKREIAIKTCPPLLQKQSIRELIFEAIDFIEEHHQLEKELFRKKFCDHLHGQMACKMAVKAGDQLMPELMQQLVIDLQKTDNRFICVHGRPTMWTLERAELEKYFKRR